MELSFKIYQMLKINDENCRIANQTIHFFYRIAPKIVRDSKTTNIQPQENFNISKPRNEF